VAQVVELLPSKHKALSSKPECCQKKKKVKKWKWPRMTLETGMKAIHITQWKIFICYHGDLEDNYPEL
jgi:hypothetical protein